eukprot:jgi/Galph1/3387/GphlegSOOS_G2039.1
MVKRAAERQLTKDDKAHEEEEKLSNESNINETGFARASEEEISRRRVIKARRLRPLLSSENSNVSTASVEELNHDVQDTGARNSNPFASVVLVPSTNTMKTMNSSLNSKQEESVDGGKSTASFEEKSAEVAVSSSEPTEKEETRNLSEQQRTGAEVSSKQGLGGLETESKDERSSKEAVQVVPRSFGGFSGGELRMDQLAKNNLGSLDKSVLRVESTSWLQPSKNVNLEHSTENKQTVKDEESDGAEQTEFDESFSNEGSVEPILPEQKTVTGEEGEQNLYKGRGKLYHLENGQWKEKGVGQLRFNVRSEDFSQARFVMRAEGNLRLLLNTLLYTNFKLDPASDRSFRFCTPGKDGKPESFLFRATSKEDAARLEISFKEWHEKCDMESDGKTRNDLS